MFHESIAPSPSANPSPYAYSSPDRDCFAETKTKTHEHSSKPPKGQTTYRIGHGPTTIARRFSSSSIVVVWALLVSLLATTGSFLVEARPAAAASRILGIGNGRLQPKQSQSQSQSQPSIYTWGNFGHVPEPQPLASRVETKLRRLVGAYRDTIIARWTAFIEHHSSLSRCLALGLRCARTYVFWYFSEDCFVSIYEDRWHAERNPDAFFGSEGMWVSKGGHKDVVRKRIQRSKRNRQWVGLGYTPRLVWLVGVLLRGTFQCTCIPKVFNPSLTGWGAGTILGAKCTHQEWIATFMIGWFGSEYYWRYLFGCNGPPFAEPGMAGIPVFITKIRDIRP